MYTLRPVFTISDDIELPKCMYTMKNIQKSAVKFSAEPETICNSKKFEDTKVSHDVLQQVNNFLKKPLIEMKALEIRQEAILEQLAQLKKQVSTLKANLKQPTQPIHPVSKTHLQTQLVSKKDKSASLYDIVINADPNHLPYSLLAIRNLWGNTFKLHVTWHTHSNLVQVSERAMEFMQANWDTINIENLPLVKISFVWKNVGKDVQLVINPMSRIAILGEVNVLRYLSYLGPPQYDYDSDIKVSSKTEVDSILDLCHSFAWGGSAKLRAGFIRTLSSKVQRSQYLSGSDLTIADIAAWSLLKQLAEPNAPTDLNANLSKWFQNCSETFAV